MYFFSLKKFRDNKTNYFGCPLNNELHKIMKRTKNVYHMQLRKCKKASEWIKNSKLIENSIENDKDLFKEIKKTRGKDTDEAANIDGKTGKDIPNRFKDVYKELFNRVDDQENIKNLSDVINEKLMKIH